MREPEPTDEPPASDTPATLDTSTSEMLATGDSSIAFATSMDEIWFGTSERRCAPVTVVITGASSTATLLSETFSVAVCPLTTVTTLFRSPYPMRSTRTETEPAGMPRRRKVPSAFVTAPIDVPGTFTCASAIGVVDPASVTRPDTLPRPDCAISATGKSTASTSVTIRRGKDMSDPDLFEWTCDSRQCRMGTCTCDVEASPWQCGTRPPYSGSRTSPNAFSGAVVALGNARRATTVALNRLVSVTLVAISGVAVAGVAPVANTSTV